MPGNPASWSNPTKLMVGIGSIVAILTTLLVIGLLHGPSGGGGRAPVLDPSEVSLTPTPPGAEPSSGPTEVPPPGSLETVEVREVRLAPPVPLDATGDFGTGVTLRITDVESVRGVGRGPGEVSGPALRLTLEARNGAASAVSLEGMVVALAHGAEDTPAMPLTEPGAAPFGGELAPGEAATGVYVFGVPTEARGRVTVSASYTGKAPTLVYRGDAARAAR